MILCEQRDAKPGLEQTLLRGETVDRSPAQIAKAMRVKQREDVRGRDLAASRYFREGDPALLAELGKLADAPAGERMVGRTHDEQLLGTQQLTFEVTRPV